MDFDTLWVSIKKSQAAFLNSELVGFKKTFYRKLFEKQKDHLFCATRHLLYTLPKFSPAGVNGFASIKSSTQLLGFQEYTTIKLNSIENEVLEAKVFYLKIPFPNQKGKKLANGKTLLIFGG